MLLFNRIVIFVCNKDDGRFKKRIREASSVSLKLLETGKKDFVAKIEPLQLLSDA